MRMSAPFFARRTVPDLDEVEAIAFECLLVAAEALVGPVRIGATDRGRAVRSTQPRECIRRYRLGPIRQARARAEHQVLEVDQERDLLSSGADLPAPWTLAGFGRTHHPHRLAPGGLGGRHDGRPAPNVVHQIGVDVALSGSSAVSSTAAILPGLTLSDR
jgi:hypothetical protein